MAKHNNVGKIGEKIAVNFLKKKGFYIERVNYWKPYGELDIVARENDLTRFVEVKSVSYETDSDLGKLSVRPEENLHHHKIKRLKKVIESYVISHETGEWVFDLVLVYVNQKTHSAHVKWLKDIILE